MRQLSRLLLAVGVIAFAAAMLAVSCGKTGDNNNNNNNANNSGGNNSGDGGNDGDGSYKRPALISDPGEIKIINVDGNLAKVTGGTTILLKLSAFPTQAMPDNVDSLIKAIAEENSRIKKVFDIVNDKASEGIVLVAKGNVASAETITTPDVTNVATRTNRFFTVNYGIHVVSAPTADGGVSAGLNFFGSFKGSPTSFNPSNTAQVAPNVEPFVFSKTSGAFTAIQPVFWCVANVPSAAAVAATDKLTGGHVSTCSVANFGGVPYGGTATAAVNNRNTWFGAADPFKREIQIAIAAIRTDGWTIGDLLGDDTAPAESSAFSDGLTDAEMKRLLKSNSKPVPFKKFNIKIVNDTDFANAP